MWDALNSVNSDSEDEDDEDNEDDEDEVEVEFDPQQPNHKKTNAVTNSLVRMGHFASTFTCLRDVLAL